MTAVVTAPAISAVRALDHAGEIKALFLAHGRPEFPDFFDRTYPHATLDGATSWIGRDAGRVVMHIALLPRRFTFGAREVTAGLLANLVVATAYRSFFPALALVRRLVDDSRDAGNIDFLYCDPNAESRALLRGIHFETAGTLQRYVVPVRDSRRYLDIAVRLFHSLLRVARRDLPAGKGARLVPHHDRALYVSRLMGYPSDRDWWFTAPQASLLVRGPDDRGLATLHAVRGASPQAVGAVIPDLIAELRGRGCERLQVTTVAESDLGRAFRRSGFLARSETLPLFALPLTPLGRECVRAVQGWEITDLDCDR